MDIFGISQRTFAKVRKAKVHRTLYIYIYI